MPVAARSNSPSNHEAPPSITHARIRPPRVRSQCAAFVVLASAAFGCGNEAPVTIVEPVYGDACKFVECPATAVCATEESGASRCYCHVGYTGADCERCEAGFHRDAFDRCISDKRCSELAADPCGDSGECLDDDGVIACDCEWGHAGPRCQLCAAGYSRDGASACLPTALPAAPDGGAPGFTDGGAPDGGTIDRSRPDAGSSDAALETGTLDAAICDPGHAGPSCTDCAPVSETFDLLSGWPAPPNTCATRAELAISGLTLRSRQGEGTVQLCAASTIHGFTTPHVELEAGPARLAELRFTEPAESVSFSYATRLQPLSLDVLADGRQVGTIELPRKSSSTLRLELDPPAMTLSLRSRTPYLQNVALDAVSHRSPTCE